MFLFLVEVSYMLVIHDPCRFSLEASAVQRIQLIARS